MASERIPERWREAVIAVLRSADRSKIKITKRAYDEFFAQFPDLWRYDLYAFLAQSLSDPNLVGRIVHDLKPPGEAYEFICTCRGEPVYVKIDLVNEGQSVVIVSAHRPTKGNRL